MIQVKNNKDNTLFYDCSCGTNGFCVVKPQEEDVIIIVDVQCPICGDIERVVLLQYSSEENKKKALTNLNELDLRCVYVGRTVSHGMEV